MLRHGRFQIVENIVRNYTNGVVYFKLKRRGMYGRRDVVNDCQSWVVHWKAGMYGVNALLRWF